MSVSRRHWRIENWLFHVKNDNCGEGSHKLQSYTAGTIVGLLRAIALNLLSGPVSSGVTHPVTAYADWGNGHPTAVLAASEMVLLNEDRDLTILILVPKLR